MAKRRRINLNNPNIDKILGERRRRLLVRSLAVKYWERGLSSQRKNQLWQLTYNERRKIMWKEIRQIIKEVDNSVFAMMQMLAEQQEEQIQKALAGIR